MNIKSLFTVLFLSPAVINAQKDYTSSLDQYMQAQSKINEFSGVVLVVRKEAIIYEKAFGLADREAGILNTVQTKFRIASISKQFTAAAILYLAQNKKLDLNDSLTKFFPDYPNGSKVTVRMLLNHTSGIKNINNLPQFYSIYTQDYPIDSIVNLFKYLPYDFTPGSKYNYSNSGYILLARIIEKVTDETYDRYVEDNILKPAGLTNTEFKMLDVATGEKATAYARSGSGWRKSKIPSLSFLFGNGGHISTAEDLYKWNKELFGGKILSNEFLKKMTTPYLNSYGYGMQISFLNGHQRFGHSGEATGFRAGSDYYPSDDLYVEVLSNNGAYSPLIAQALAALMFNIDVTPPYKREVVKIDSSILSKYLGVYKEPDSDFRDTVTTRNGKLYWHQQDGREFELKPESNFLFFLTPIPDVQFLFEINSEGKLKKTYLIEAGLKKEIKKLQ